MLMGSINPEDRGESDVKPKEWPKHLPPKVYRSRTDFLISKLEGESDDTDYDDHILQLPWTPE